MRQTTGTHRNQRFAVAAQVADYMGCTEISQQLVKWLQGALREVVDYGVAAEPSHSAHLKPPRISYLKQACCCLYMEMHQLGCLWTTKTTAACSNSWLVRMYDDTTMLRTWSFLRNNVGLSHVS